MRGYSRGVGFLVLLLGLTVTAGWILGLPSLTGLVADWPQMSPLTAAAVTLCAAALLLAGESPASQLRHRAALGCALLAMLLGLTRLAGHLLGAGAGFDSLGLQTLITAHGMRPATMSPPTALAVTLVGGALMLMDTTRWTRAFQALALLAALDAWLGLTRYLFGGVPLIPYNQTALHTALILILLATGTLALRRDIGIAALLVNSGPAGASVRLLLPAALLVPLLAGSLTLYATHRGLLRVEQSFALFALSNVLVFAGLIWEHGRQLVRADAQRQAAEKARRASDERTRLIVENALDAVLTIDSAGIITGWNPQAESLFGWTAAEALGRTIATTIIPPRYRDAHQRGLERYLTTDIQTVLNRRIELPALRRDQSEFPVELTITPIRSGERVSFSAFVRDITERQRAQERLRIQAERLSLLDRSTRAIGERQDLRSILQVAIRSLEEHLPLDFACVGLLEPAQQALEIACIGVRSRALGLQLALTEQARVAIDQNGLGRCAKGELVYEPDLSGSRYPFTARLAAGGLRSVVIAPLSVERRVFGALIVARQDANGFASSDCEFLRQLSEHLALAAHQAQLYASLQRAYEDLRQTQDAVMQQERLRALGQMAGGIAHDINNALSPAALYLESLLERDRTLSEQARQSLTITQRAIDDVSRTVARLRLFYQRAETEQALVPVDLNGLLQQVVDLTRARWNDMPQKRGAVIEVRRELASGLPAVLGAENEIRDALTNLVLNAVDAMPTGGTLTVRSQRRPPGGTADTNEVAVEIIDTGMGMSAAVRQRCLEPFFTTKGERGSGLGLAMVYGMVQRHRAAIEIESEPGAGTTIRMMFPRAPVPQARPPGTEARAHAPSLRLLLIDDDPLILRSLRQVLES